MRAFMQAVNVRFGSYATGHFPPVIRSLDQHRPRFGEQHQLPFDYEPEKDSGKGL